MSKIIFHGSDHIIESPRFGFGKGYNDYGLAFYCTAHIDMACEWAVGNGSSGFANKYRFDDEGLNTVNLNGEEFTTLHWLTVLLENRLFDVHAPLANAARRYLIDNFSVDLSAADVVKGYRADDCYFSFAQDFLSGAISYRQLQQAMRLGNLGQQIAIKSERAFERLTFVDALPAPKGEWLPRRQQRDLSARLQYLDTQQLAHKKGDLYVAQIIDEEMRPGDARL